MNEDEISKRKEVCFAKQMEVESTNAPARIYAIGYFRIHLL